MKYFVYSKNASEDDQSLLYVAEDKIKDFAVLEYNVKTMEYCGVMIEAESPVMAHEVFNYRAEGEIYSTEEPTETSKAKRLYSVLQAMMPKSEEVKPKSEIAGSLREINLKIAALAKFLKKYGKSELDEQAIFNSLKEEYIKIFIGLGYPDSE